jgi:hypothetical protein
MGSIVGGYDCGAVTAITGLERPFVVKSLASERPSLPTNEDE